MEQTRSHSHKRGVEMVYSYRFGRLRLSTGFILSTDENGKTISCMCKCYTQVQWLNIALYGLYGIIFSAKYLVLASIR